MFGVVCPLVSPYIRFWVRAFKSWGANDENSASIYKRSLICTQRFVFDHNIYCLEMEDINGSIQNTFSKFPPWCYFDIPSETFLANSIELPSLLSACWSHHQIVIQICFWLTISWTNQSIIPLDSETEMLSILSSFYEE